jgi:hypothetical protein
LPGKSVCGLNGRIFSLFDIRDETDEQKKLIEAIGKQKRIHSEKSLSGRTAPLKAARIWMALLLSRG